MAPMVSRRLVSVKVNGGSCVVYSSCIWYSIVVVLFCGVCVSFSMITAFPVAFASAQAIALLRRHPTASCVLECFCVSWQISLSMLPVNSIVILSFWVCISAVSAISMCSMRSLGRFCWR